jgi:GTP diphosphokinase / guanosine-3',5'-bis(diphosphate) 3'-diphosphatase
MAIMHVTILIRNKDHLQSVVDKIKRVKDIFSVQRLMQ